MAGSKTKRIADARERILNIICSYVLLAQDIELREEDDFNELGTEIDVVLEELVFQQQR